MYIYRGRAAVVDLSAKHNRRIRHCFERLRCEGVRVGSWCTPPLSIGRHRLRSQHGEGVHGQVYRRLQRTVVCRQDLRPGQCGILRQDRW